MNLKYSQIQIVVTSSKYCVKSRNESCVPFLSNCNTFIQSLQLKVFAGKEDLGCEVPQGSYGYREDGESLREEARPSLACPPSRQSHAEASNYPCCALEGSQPSPYQQPITRGERGSRRPPLAGTSLLPFSFSSELPPMKTQLPIFQTFSLKLSAGLQSHMDPPCP